MPPMIPWYAPSMNELTIARQAIAHRGKRLEYFTIVWNFLEGLVAIAAGAVSGSISLVGFGIDSFIEVTSGATLLWRMSVDSDVERRERNERVSLRIVGVCFLALAAYITYESVSDLARKTTPEHSIPGIALACVSLVVMPILSRAKSQPKIPAMQSEVQVKLHRAHSGESIGQSSRLIEDSTRVRVIHFRWHHQEGVRPF